MASSVDSSHPAAFDHAASEQEKRQEGLLHLLITATGRPAHYEINYTHLERMAPTFAYLALFPHPLRRMPQQWPKNVDLEPAGLQIGDHATNLPL